VSTDFNSPDTPPDEHRIHRIGPGNVLQNVVFPVPLCPYSSMRIWSSRPHTSSSSNVVLFGVAFWFGSCLTGLGGTVNLLGKV
jgi:hypothetical protein